jgi:hypothetical protein
VTEIITKINRQLKDIRMLALDYNLKVGHATQGPHDSVDFPISRRVNGKLVTQDVRISTLMFKDTTSTGAYYSMLYGAFYQGAMALYDHLNDNKEKYDAAWNTRTKRAKAMHLLRSLW